MVSSSFFLSSITIFIFYPFNWSVTVQCLCLDFEVCSGESGWSVYERVLMDGRGGWVVKAELGSIDWWCDWHPPLCCEGLDTFPLTTCTAKCVMSARRWNDAECRGGKKQIACHLYIYTDICLGEYAIAKEFLCVWRHFSFETFWNFHPTSEHMPWVPVDDAICEVEQVPRVGVTLERRGGYGARRMLCKVVPRPEGLKQRRDGIQISDCMNSIHYVYVYINIFVCLYFNIEHTHIISTH